MLVFRGISGISSQINRVKAAGILLVISPEVSSEMYSGNSSKNTNKDLSSNFPRNSSIILERMLVEISPRNFPGKSDNGSLK